MTMFFLCFPRSSLDTESLPLLLHPSTEHARNVITEQEWGMAKRRAQNMDATWRWTGRGHDVGGGGWCSGGKAGWCRGGWPGFGQRVSESMRP